MRRPGAAAAAAAAAVAAGPRARTARGDARPGCGGTSLCGGDLRSAGPGGQQVAAAGRAALGPAEAHRVSELERP